MSDSNTTEATFRVLLHIGYGRFTGTTHLYTTSPMTIGRIKRGADESLCGAPMPERIDDRTGKERAACKRCTEIAKRVPA